MNESQTFPLFRTASPVLAEPTAPATEQPTPTTSPVRDELDITDCVGATVDPATWHWLQAEVQRRYGGAWTLYADQIDDGFVIRRLTAKP